MATINYNGMELEEVTEPQIFDPPKKMLVWNNIMDYAIQSMIVAIVERMDGLCAICYDGEIYPHCAEIPEAPKPRRATNRELSRWLAQGNGEYILQITAGMAEHYWNYEDGDEDEPANGYDSSDNELKVRKWSDNEWHEPTVDYMGLEDK